MLRRLGGWLLVVVGLLMAIAGAGSAIIVGPDNAVQSGIRQLASPGAAIVTGPGVIEYTGPTLRLEARSSAGPVFLAVGSEVDVQDLMADVTRTQVDDIDPMTGDLQTSEIAGGQDLLVDVAELDWWIESSEADVAVVDFSLPKQPVSVVMMNADGSAPVHVELAAEVSIRGLFWGLLAAALIGIGVLNLGVLVLFRARARRRAGQSRAEEPDPERVP